MFFELRHRHRAWKAVRQSGFSLADAQIRLHRSSFRMCARRFPPNCLTLVCHCNGQLPLNMASCRPWTRCFPVANTLPNFTQARGCVPAWFCSSSTGVSSRCVTEANITLCITNDYPIVIILTSSLTPCHWSFIHVWPQHDSPRDAKGWSDLAWFEQQ